MRAQDILLETLGKWDPPSVIVRDLVLGLPVKVFPSAGDTFCGEEWLIVQTGDASSWTTK